MCRSSWGQNQIPAQVDGEEPPPKRIKAEAAAGQGNEAGKAKDTGRQDSTQQEDAVDGEDKGAQPARIPICDLETLRELEGVQAGCCILTLRQAMLQHWNGEMHCGTVAGID